MRIVVALGGNALSRRGEPFDVELQRRRVHDAMRALASVAEQHALVITHGNGPQVGALALQAERSGGPRVPLDVLGAESEGLIGYLVQQEMGNVLPHRDVATLLTEVVVSADDPAFARPTKPIGPVYARAEGERLGRERGWTMVKDGRGVRRAVPSPRPLAVRGLRAIRRLMDGGVIVVCAGGGGIPVVAAPDGRLHGVEAVIDKDLSAALLAEGVAAHALVMLTDTPGVVRGWGTPEAVVVGEAHPDELRALAFDAGSMGPKVDAACRFVERTGGWAAIGALDDAEAIVRGEAGTRVRPRAPQTVAGVVTAVGAASVSVAGCSDG